PAGPESSDADAPAGQMFGARTRGCAVRASRKLSVFGSCGGPGVDSVAAMASPKVLAMVLAGGEGKRLMPLTADRAKPAVPFGGVYRMIDFALSNLVNGGYLRVVVLTQYKSHSLDRHVTKTWRMSNLLGNYITPVTGQH